MGLTSLTAINSVLLEGEVLESANLVEVVLDLLDDTRRTVLAKVIHGVEGLENTFPLLGLRMHLQPEVLEDDVVVLPVVGVVSQNLKLAI